MKTIKNIENTIIINKSKFITNLIYIENIDDVKKNLDMIKNKCKDATHHCYAYIIDNIKRFNDDKEPNGTAGIPILECLEKKNLNHILCIVTRYFGGIKLGAGGLVRAYTASVSTAIEKTEKLELYDGYLVEINFDYDKIAYIDRLLENVNITKKKFSNTITYNIECDKCIIDNLQKIGINSKTLKKLLLRK